MSRRRGLALPTAATRRNTAAVGIKQEEDITERSPDHDRLEQSASSSKNSIVTTAPPRRGKDVRRLQCLQAAAIKKLQEGEESHVKQDRSAADSEAPSLVKEEVDETPDEEKASVKQEEQASEDSKKTNDEKPAAEHADLTPSAATPNDMISWLHQAPFSNSVGPPSLPAPLPIVASSSSASRPASLNVPPAVTSASASHPVSLTPGLVQHGQALSPGVSNWSGLTAHLSHNHHDVHHHPFGWMLGLPYHFSPGLHTAGHPYSFDFTHSDDDDDDDEGDDEDDAEEDLESTGADAKDSLDANGDAQAASFMTTPSNDKDHSAVLLSHADGTPLALLESKSANVSELLRRGEIQMKSLVHGSGTETSVTAILNPEEASTLTPTPARKYLRWTEQEDETLREAVEEQDDAPPINWKRISRKYFKGLRSSVQCKNRWKKCLQPGLRRDPWTPKENDIIADSVAKGLKWSEIGKLLDGRIPEQIRDHWINQLDPSLNKGPWTEEEVEILFRCQAKMGNKWSDIAKMLPGRSENGVKNRWHNAKVAQRRKLKKLAKEAEVAERLKAARSHEDLTPEEEHELARQESLKRVRLAAEEKARASKRARKS